MNQQWKTIPSSLPGQTVVSTNLKLPIMFWENLLWVRPFIFSFELYELSHI